jgi:hypothetical protein
VESVELQCGHGVDCFLQQRNREVVAGRVDQEASPGVAGLIFDRDGRPWHQIAESE